MTRAQKEWIDRLHRWTQFGGWEEPTVEHLREHDDGSLSMAFFVRRNDVKVVVLVRTTGRLYGVRYGKTKSRANGRDAANIVRRWLVGA